MNHFLETIANHEAFDRLWSFIQTEYPNRGYAFHTSWTTYATCSTTEEEILCACTDALKSQQDGGFDVLSELPAIILALIQARAKKLSERTKAIKFLNDAITDAIQCNCNEYTAHELEDDEFETEEAA
jgi:hypothetical protein